MARARTAVTRTKTGTEIVVLQGGANTPARRRSGGGGRPRRRRGRRGRGGASKGSQGVQKQIQQVALGGLAYGLAIKYFGAQIPRLPGIGRSGTLAALIYLLKPSNNVLQNMGVAAAAIAGASFGETGTVSGSGEDQVLTND